MSKYTAALKEQVLLDKYWNALRGELQLRKKMKTHTDSEMQQVIQIISELREKSHRFLVELTQALSNREPTAEEKREWQDIFGLLEEITRKAKRIPEEEVEALHEQQAAVERFAQIAREKAEGAKAAINQGYHHGLIRIEEAMREPTTTSKTRENLAKLKLRFTQRKDKALVRIDELKEEVLTKLNKIKAAVSKAVDKLLHRGEVEISVPTNVKKLNTLFMIPEPGPSPEEGQRRAERADIIPVPPDESQFYAQEVLNAAMAEEPELQADVEILVDSFIVEMQGIVDKIEIQDLVKAILNGPEDLMIDFSEDSSEEEAAGHIPKPFRKGAAN